MHAVDEAGDLAGNGEAGFFKTDREVFSEEQQTRKSYPPLSPPR